MKDSTVWPKLIQAHGSEILFVVATPLYRLAQPITIICSLLDQSIMCSCGVDTLPGRERAGGGQSTTMEITFAIL
jgi:hypothetical protein